MHSLFCSLFWYTISTVPPLIDMIPPLISRSSITEYWKFLMWQKCGMKPSSQKSTMSRSFKISCLFMLLSSLFFQQSIRTCVEFLLSDYWFHWFSLKKQTRDAVKVHIKIHRITKSSQKSSQNRRMFGWKRSLGVIRSNPLRISKDIFN